MAQLKFYKLGAEAMAQKTVAEGAIWFNKDQKTIEVYNGTSWEKFAGSLEDATWANDILTIKKYDGSKLELDFSNVASTTSVVKALSDLKGELLGAESDTADKNTIYGAKAAAAAASASVDTVEASIGLAQNGSHVTTTGNYTSTATTVVGEIAALDAKLKEVSDSVDQISNTSLSGINDKINALEQKDIAHEERMKATEDEIDAMDASFNIDGAHVKVVLNQVDGKITEFTVSESDIASAQALADEIDRAGKAEKANADAIAVLNGGATEAGSVAKAVADAKAEILGDAAADFNTLGKLEDKIQAVEGAAKSYSIAAVTGDELSALGANVKEAYKLVDEDSAKAGEYIKIYKDSALQGVALVDQELKFTYLLADGTSSTVGVDVSKFLAETEFANGLQVVDHVVSVKVDQASESFLSVSADGVKLSGVQDAIDTAIAGVNTTIEENEKVTAEGLNDLNTRLLAIEGAVDTENTVAEQISAAVTPVANRVSDLETAVNTTLPQAIADAQKAAEDYADGLAGNYEAAGTVSALNATVKDEADYIVGEIVQTAGLLTSVSFTAKTGAVADGGDVLATSASVKSYVDAQLSSSLAWESFE